MSTDRQDGRHGQQNSAVAVGQPKRHLNDTADVKAMLQVRIDDLVHRLLPGGRRSGKYYFAKNPRRNDTHAGSFWVSMSGVPGSWRDEATGEKGDVFGLIAFAENLPDFKTTIAWARDFLGLARMPEAERAKYAAKAKQFVAGDSLGADDAERIAKARGRAQAIWLKSRNRVAGTLAETYLAARSIDIHKLPRLSSALRFDPDAVHDWQTGEMFPAIRTMMTLPDGKFGALHTIFLSLDGRSKALVSPPRKIFASYIGCAMRLARGASNLDVVTAAERGVKEPLVLCEGVEDALSISIACPELRVWAVGALNNLAHQVPPACCSEIIVAADNDWGKPQAQQQLQRAIARLSSHDRPVSIMRSHIGKDANDALRGAA